MEDGFFMKEIQRQGDLCKEKKGLTFNEFLPFGEESVESAIQELMDEIEIFAIFKKMEKSDNMRMNQELLMGLPAFDHFLLECF